MACRIDVGAARRCAVKRSAWSMTPRPPRPSGRGRRRSAARRHRRTSSPHAGGDSSEGSRSHPNRPSSRGSSGAGRTARRAGTCSVHQDRVPVARRVRALPRCGRAAGSGSGRGRTRRRTRTRREEGRRSRHHVERDPDRTAVHLPEPKSAWTGASSPIEAISWAESEAMGSLSTRWFHALFAGKTGQCRAAGRRNACAADPGRSRSAKAAETDATRAFMVFPSAEESPILSPNGDGASPAAGPCRRRRRRYPPAPSRAPVGGRLPVETAEDGRAALRVFHENPTDVVVLDLSMPDLDGFETLERLRDVSDVPVILLTARSGEIDKVRGFRGGADDYVVKPFGRQELLARIEALLRRAPEPTTPGALRRRCDLHRLRQAPCHVPWPAGQPHTPRIPSAGRLRTASRTGVVGGSADRALLGTRGRGLARPGEALRAYVRKKLGQDSDDWQPIETVRGFGYRYVPPSS